uniref:Uncharacterized protein n=1 Tax=Amphimedon queenslandica TaxID=400682 RepID=A0A1X7V0H1_AMPQE
MGLLGDTIYLTLVFGFPMGIHGAALLVLGIIGYVETKSSLKRMKNSPVKKIEDVRNAEINVEFFINGVINPIVREDGRRLEVTATCEAEKRSREKLDSMSNVASRVNDIVPGMGMKDVSSILTAASQFGVILPGDTDTSPKGAAKRHFKILTKMEIERKEYPKPRGWWKRKYYLTHDDHSSVDFALTDNKGQSITVNSFDSAIYFNALMMNHEVFKETEPCPEEQQKLYAGFKYNGYDLEIETTECILPYGTMVGLYGHCIDSEQEGRKFLPSRVGTSPEDILNRYTKECNKELKSNRYFIVLGSTLLGLTPVVIGIALMVKIIQKKAN